MKRNKDGTIETWITSKIASCMDCDWYDEDVRTATQNARNHAERHGHKVVLEAAKVTHYNYRGAGSGEEKIT